MIEFNKEGGSLPLINSLSFTFSHLDEPWKLLPLIFNKPVRVRVKWSTNGGIILRNKRDFWRLRDVTFNGWKIIDIKNDLIYLRKNGLIIVGPITHIGVVKEPLDVTYNVFNYENKTVLDIGGYIGYSAALFSKWGAKKVIIYEVQRNNIGILKENLKLNQVNGEIYNLAIADKDGEIEINYENIGSTDFGLGGPNKYRAKAISVSKVLMRHDIDIAKFDCEGCEYSLLSVPCEVLRRVPRYVIEYHRGFEALKKKFEKCGYCVKHLWTIKPGIGGLKAVMN